MLTCLRLICVFGLLLLAVSACESDCGPCLETDGDTEGLADGDGLDGDELDGDITSPDGDDEFVEDDNTVEACPQGCWIGEVCIPDGFPNTQNPCQICTPQLSNTAWSDNDGQTCNDGVFCNGADSCAGGTCSVNAGDPCVAGDGVYCNGEETCNEEQNRCDHPGDPCSEDELCIEAAGQCCRPNVVDSDPECDANGDVIAYDSCGYQLLVEDCHDSNGTCTDGICGCKTGWGGENCDCVIFVDREADDGEDGISWDSAFQKLQDGIDAAVAAGSCAVWVKGIADTGLTYEGNFEMHHGLELYGGFAGTETSAGQRDLETYVSILDSQDNGTVIAFIGSPAHEDSGVLDGFTLTGGTDSGMRIENAAPEISNCTFIGNSAAMGGGIHIKNGDPTLTNCLFIDNEAVEGMDGENGASADGPNDAEDGTPGILGGSGGGMYIEDGSSQLFGCRFENNSAGSGGAGVRGGYDPSPPGGGDGGDGGDGGHGGGMLVNGGSPQLFDCLFAGNRAGSGGDGGRSGGSDDGDAGHGGTGAAGGTGGAIHIENASPAFFSCRFEENAAGDGGLGGESYLGRIGGDGGYGGDGGSGGAIFIGVGTPVFIDCLFKDNATGNGSDGGVTHQDRNIGAPGGSGGSGGSGGGIFIGEGTPHLINCRFAGNKSGDGGNGQRAADTTLSHEGTGSGGHGGQGGSGGGLHIGSGESMLIGCLFDANSTGAGGSGSDGGTDQSGTTRGGDGGWGGEAGSGGGIRLNGGTMHMINGTLADNATSAGGAAGMGGTGSTSGSDGIHGSDGMGGGIFSYQTTVSLTNSILWGNEALGSGPQIEDVSSSPTVRYSNVQGGFDGTENLDVDPKFIDDVNGILHLQPDSECIDAGDDAPLPLDFFDLDQDGNTDEQLPVDLDGHTRVVGDTVDMGAYEFEADRCGNYLLEEGEACDDGNNQDGDGCSAGCDCETGSGLAAACAAGSCALILSAYPEMSSGLFWLDPGDAGNPFRTTCDMERWGGGWTLVVNIVGHSGLHAGSADAVGAMDTRSEAAKLSDAMINQLTTEGKWLYECGQSKVAYVTNDGPSWTSLYSNAANWLIDLDLDGIFDCTANRDGFVFSDYDQCGNDADHTNYGGDGVNGCYHHPVGWEQDGALWAR